MSWAGSSWKCESKPTLTDEGTVKFPWPTVTSDRENALPVTIWTDLSVMQLGTSSSLQKQTRNGSEAISAVILSSFSMYQIILYDSHSEFHCHYQWKACCPPYKAGSVSPAEFSMNISKRELFVLFLSLIKQPVSFLEGTSIVSVGFLQYPNTSLSSLWLQ